MHLHIKNANYDSRSLFFAIFADAKMMNVKMTTHKIPKRMLTTACMFMLAVVIAWAQGPNNTGTYYQTANGKKGEALKTAMFGIIKITEAGWSYKELKNAYTITDVRPDGCLRDWYSQITHYKPGSDFASSSNEEGGGYNREHLVPQSWFSSASPMVSDAFHVVPTDAKINNMRGSYPFGEVGTITDSSNNNYCKKGYSKRSGYTGIVFEPGYDIKGDIARAYFYMVTCYQDKISSWASNDVFDGRPYPGLKDWTLQMMMEWSANDPVDDVERARNEAIYNKQRNRNPFIDYPGLEEYVWGTKTDIAFDYTNNGSSTTIVAAPTFSLAEGTYTTAQNVTLACSTSCAVIYYTTDGTTPLASSTQYQGAITISTTTTLKAIAIKDGISSEVAEAVYIINSGGNIPNGEILVWESFSKYTSDSDGTTEITLPNNKLDFDSWTSFTKVYFGGGGCGKLGNSSTPGSMEASRINLIGKGELTFKVKKYSTDGGKLNVTITGATATGNMQITPQNSWTEYTIALTEATGNVKITFATSSKRAYIDDIKLVSTNEDTPILLGDADHNGQVNVTDVTALVNIVLGKDDNEPHIYNHQAADVNKDGKVDITDVTELVNMILKNG